MKLAVPIALVLLAGCAPTIRDTFTVSVADRDAASAVLSICGVRTPMKQSGSRFETTYPIDCEGEGDVLVRYADGASIKCHIGYVTRDAGQDWRFAVQNRSCGDIGHTE